jgi:non-canonical purine NTP pyrophosphatase, rdgB/HAM1 family
VDRIVVASNNPGKLRELAALLAPLGLEAINQSTFGIGEADEPFDTFIENALAKARHASKATGLAAIADDSGLCVPSLGGEPGVHSAYYAGHDGTREVRDARNNAKLVAALRGAAERSAFYYCVLVIVRSAKVPTPAIADGRWHGSIVVEPRGRGGFGYDPYFLPSGASLTAAEMPPEEKNRVSHRARAMAALREKLAPAS